MSQYPFLGASPDALIYFACCKNGYVIEIKCLYKFLLNTLEELLKNNKNFCLEYDNENKKYSLKPEHAYFYQIQLQMLLTGRPQGYFVVYSKQICIIEKIYFSKNFMDTYMLKKEKSSIC